MCESFLADLHPGSIRTMASLFTRNDWLNSRKEWCWSEVHWNFKKRESLLYAGFVFCPFNFWCWGRIAQWNNVASALKFYLLCSWETVSLVFFQLYYLSVLYRIFRVIGVNLRISFWNFFSSIPWIFSLLILLGYLQASKGNTYASVQK